VRGVLLVGGVLTLAAASATPAGNHQFLLYVANQSPDVNPVDIKVTIDGRTVIDQDFYSEGDNVWWQVEMFAVAGRHVLRASTTKGAATLRREFTVTGRHWAVLMYRNVTPEKDGPTVHRFVLIIRDRPLEDADYDATGP
jgi:hypothetical protein